METPSEAEVRAIVRRVLLRTLGLAPTMAASASAPLPSPRPSGAPGEGTGPAARPVITEAIVQQTPPNSTLEIPPNALVTPLARDTAEVRGIRLVSSELTSLTPSPRRKGGREVLRIIALGADHAGYRLKEVLKGFVEELGYGVIDCGTNGPDAVDYPDFAYAVARLVAEGRAWRGIIVDGAGIGSCMAANKVPGIRAALCYDQATAVNSREHNDANVLTLGAGLIGEHLARQIVKTWLETEFGGGRHARRVAKIVAIEKRYLK